MDSPLRLFYSFDEQDKVYCQSLEQQIKPMKRLKYVLDWHAGCVNPGQEWAQDIHEHLGSADLIVPLLSPAFMANDFCFSEQMTVAMMRHLQGSARVLPVVVRPVDLQDTPFIRLKTLPSGGQPVTKWVNGDEAWLDVALGIRSAISELRAIRNTPVPAAMLPLPAVPQPVNLGFDHPPGPDGMPPGWSNSVGYVSGVSRDYEYLVLKRTDAPGSVLRARSLTGDKSGFGSIMQRCPASAWAGRRIRFSGYLCTQAITGCAWLWLRADGETTPNLYFYNMNDRPVRGTTPWTEYCIEAVLPPGTAWLNFGIAMEGAGALWADHLSLQLV